MCTIVTLRYAFVYDVSYTVCLLCSQAGRGLQVGCVCTIRGKMDMITVAVYRTNCMQLLHLVPSLDIHRNKDTWPVQV